MKNLKKLLAVIVSICVLATFTVPAFAAETTKTDAAICADLGVLQGEDISVGVTAEYLAKGTTRLQAALLYLRLIGKETEARAFTGTETFADAKLVDWTEGKAVLAYLKAHPELGWLGDGTNFDPNGAASAQMLYKVALEALGYKQDVDFTYADTITFAATVGLTKVAAITELTNDNTATALVEALKATVKGGTMTLVEKLAASDATLKAAAIADGLIVEDVTAVATVTGAKIFTVTFNKEVDTTKATFAVKKGSVTMAVSKTAFDDAKKVATITMVSPLTAGDYVITVGGLDLKVTDYTVTAAASKVATIEIASDIAPKVATSPASVTFSYAVKNQYGEKITASTSLTWTASTGTISVDAATGTGTVAFASEQLKDTTFVVTAIESSTGVYATKVLKVGDVAKVAKINVLGLYNADNKTLYNNSTFTDFYVKVEAFDQYNNKVGIAALNDATQTTVVPSNTAIVNKGAFVVVDSTTALQLAAGSGTAGTAVINFISNITGQSSSATITVTKAAALDALTLSVPADLAVKGEIVKIPFTAQDQYGVELSETAKGALTASDLTLTSTDPAATLAFSYNYETKKAELALDLKTNAAVTTGSKIIMAVTKTGKVSQITVDVKAVAVPSTVSGIKDAVATKMSVGAVSALAESNIIVIDQYGRAMTTNAAWFTNYKLAIATGTAGKVALSADAGVTTASALEITADAGSVSLLGVAAGTSTISVSVKKVDNTAIANSTFEFTAETTAKSVITEYVVEAPETIYAGAGHAKDFNVYGKTASGAKVALAPADFVASSNLAGVSFATAGKIDANGAQLLPSAWAANTDKTATVVVLVDAANGPQSVTKSITVSNKAPALATIAVDATEYLDLSAGDTVASLVAAQFTGKDQYGVAFTPVVTNIMVTNVSGVTVTGNGGTAPVLGSAAAGDSFQVTIITDNGLTKSTNVVIVP